MGRCRDHRVQGRDGPLGTGPPLHLFPCRTDASQPGTYDFLSTFSFSAPPSSGASGGPIVGPSGSVVGLIRGSRADYGDRQARGFAVVSERLWEVFKLPSFKLASEKRREEAERAAAAAEGGRGKDTK